jgi:hypothetical protein
MAKVLVSFDDELLRRIDTIARARRVSRSAYLAQIAEQDVNRAAGPGSLAPARRALARLDRLFADGPAGDSTIEVRAERDSR